MDISMFLKSTNTTLSANHHLTLTLTTSLRFQFKNRNNFISGLRAAVDPQNNSCACILYYYYNFFCCRFIYLFILYGTHFLNNFYISVSIYLEIAFHSLLWIIYSVSWTRGPDHWNRLTSWSGSLIELKKNSFMKQAESSTHWLNDAVIEFEAFWRQRLSMNNDFNFSLFHPLEDTFSSLTRHMHFAMCVWYFKQQICLLWIELSWHGRHLQKCIKISHILLSAAYLTWR